MNSLPNYLAIKRFTDNDRRLFLDLEKYKNHQDQLLLKCEPIVYALSLQYRNKLCSNCLKELNLLRCSKCQFQYYCSKECQAEDWKQSHKNECKFLEFWKDKHNKIPNNMLILLRLFLNRIELDDFIGSIDNINEEKKKQYNEIAIILAHAFQKFSNKNTADQDEFLINIGLLMNLQAKIQLNAFTITHSISGDEIGIGLYSTVNFIDHKCQFIDGIPEDELKSSNSYVTFCGKELMLCTNDTFQKQLKKYQYLKGEDKIIELNISYADQITNRNSFLNEQYGFECRCDRCKYEEDHNNIYSSCFKFKIRKNAQNTTQLNDQLSKLMNNQDIQLLKDVSKQVQYFYDGQFQKLLEQMYIKALTEENFKDSYYILKRIIKNLPFWINSTDHPLIGWRLNEASKMAFHLDYLRKAEEFAQKGIVMLRKFYKKSDSLIELRDLEVRLIEIQSELKMNS